MHFIIMLKTITVIIIVNITFISGVFDSFVVKCLHYLPKKYVFVLGQPQSNEMMTQVDLPVHY